jgi:hypothetical protein
LARCCLTGLLLLPGPLAFAQESAVELAARIEQATAEIESLSSSDVESAITSARERRRDLIALASRDPGSAYRLALSRSQRAALPDPISAVTEERWSGFAELAVLSHGPVPRSRLILPDGREFRAHLYGARRGMTSKLDLPVHAVLLDGQAVIGESPLELLSPGEHALLQAQPDIAEMHSGRDAWTGARLDRPGLRGLVGDRLLAFGTEAAARALESRLREAEDGLDPQIGAQQILEAAPESAAAPTPSTQASPWTENPRTTFFIRVAFPDLPDEPVSQAVLQNSLDAVSGQILDASFGKTWLLPQVSEQVVTVPGNSSSYLPDQYFSLHSDAIAAFEALSTGVELANFDIIGIYVGNVGFGWAGLATVGGTRQWIQNTSSQRVLLHEYGHNYGLFHANRWDTSDGSVTGPGISIEYGNLFDVMGSGSPPEAEFGPFEKHRLDWIADGQAATPTTNGTHRLYAFDHPAADQSATLALRIPKCSDGHYWLGLRTRMNSVFALERGVSLLWQRPDRSYQSHLLHPRPGTPLTNSPITLGQTYSDPAGCAHVTPLALGGEAPFTWMDVQVNIDTAGNQTPAVTIQGPQVTPPRIFTRFTAAATDPDGDALAFDWRIDGIAQATNRSTAEHLWLTAPGGELAVTASDMRGGSATAALDVPISDPLSEPWLQRDAFGDNNGWADVAVAGGTAVVVGSTEAIAYSTDGVSWTRADTGGAFAYLSRVGYDGSQWVAMGQIWNWDLQQYEYGLMTSADASAWSVGHRVPADRSLNDLACGGGVCVAVAVEGRFVTSPSSGPVVEGQLPDAYDLSAVEWMGDRFVAAGEFPGGGYATFVSADGQSWSSPRSAPCRIDELRYLNGILLAGCSYFLYRSTDGLTFERSSDTGLFVDTFAFGNGVFVATGWNGFIGAYVRWVSIDGLRWAELGMTAEPYSGADFIADRFLNVRSGAILQSAAQVADGDRDGLPDQFELANGLDPENPADAWLDADGDGLTNQWEYLSGLNPLLADTDNDGLDDGREINELGTDPTDFDSDNDGRSDGQEIALGTDPLDGSDCPPEECALPDSSIVLKIIQIREAQRARETQ